MDDTLEFVSVDIPGDIPGGKTFSMEVFPNKAASKFFPKVDIVARRFGVMPDVFIGGMGGFSLTDLKSYISFLQHIEKTMLKQIPD